MWPLICLFELANWCCLYVMLVVTSSFLLKPTCAWAHINPVFIFQLYSFVPLSVCLIYFGHTLLYLPRTKIIQCPLQHVLSCSFNKNVCIDLFIYFCPCVWCEYNLGGYLHLVDPLKLILITECSPIIRYLVISDIMKALLSQKMMSCTLINAFSRVSLHPTAFAGICKGRKKPPQHYIWYDEHN